MQSWWRWRVSDPKLSSSFWLTTTSRLRERFLPKWHSVQKHDTDVFGSWFSLASKMNFLTSCILLRTPSSCSTVTTHHHHTGTPLHHHTCTSPHHHTSTSPDHHTSTSPHHYASTSHHHHTSTSHHYHLIPHTHNHISQPTITEYPEIVLWSAYTSGRLHSHSVYRVLQNGCHKPHLTQDSTLNFEPTIQAR